MEFVVLGRMRVRRDGADVPLAGSLQCTLLGVLLTRANAVVSGQVLIDAMWGERADARSAQKLHLHIHRLRRALGEPDRLVSQPGGYRLVVHADEYDAQRYEALLDGDTAESLRAALALWGGEPFDGTDTPLLGAESDRLTERRLVGFERLCAAEIACGRHADIVAELAEQVRSHPLRERLHGLLMTALYRAGQQGRALAAYRSARRVLIEELGQEPGPELRRIEQRILAGEPVELDTPRSETAVPAQLPYDVKGFGARDTELSTLDEIRAEHGTIVAIAGTGGVGKTALAVHWAHRVRDSFPDGQFYVDLRGYGPEPPLTADDALGGFLRELGVDGAAIPTGLAERSARFRSLVAGRRVLIVLDNAQHAEHVRPLLPGGSTGTVLVTSRDALAGLVAREGARRIDLDRLPRADALALLRALVGERVDAEPHAAAELVGRCARLPLALRVAAELINARVHLGIGELAAELADEQRALDLLDAGGDEGTAVRAVFSWSYQRLAPDAAGAFRFIGLHPGHDLDAPALAALLGDEPAVTRTAIDALLRAHLLDETDPGRYRPHDLLRAYAGEMCRRVDGEATREAALGRLFDHYLETVRAATAEQRPDELTPLLDTELANLVAVTERAARSDRPHVSILLGDLLRTHLSLGGHHDQALLVHRAAAEAARRTGDLIAEGHAVRNLGAVHRRTARLDSGFEYLRDALHCYERAGDDYHQQMQLCNVGVVCTWSDRYAEAAEYLHKALVLADGLGADGTVGRSTALTYLGQLHIYLGEPERALTYATEALTDTDERTRQSRVNAEVIIGFAQTRLGHYESACARFEYAWRRAEELRVYPVRAYMATLGPVYWRLGRRADAFDRMEHCLAIIRGGKERLFETCVHNSAGELYLLDGSPADALAHYRQALELAETSGMRFEQARAHAGIGDVHAALGECAEAEARRLRAVRIYRGLGSADADSVPVAS